MWKLQSSLRPAIFLGLPRSGYLAYPDDDRVELLSQEGTANPNGIVVGRRYVVHLRFWELFYNKYVTAGVVSMFAPFTNYSLGHIEGALANWKYMCIFAGSMTVLWILVILVFLPPGPVCGRGFSEREHYIAIARLRLKITPVCAIHISTKHRLLRSSSTRASG